MSRAQRRALLTGVYAIVNESSRAVDIASAALDAGITVVQYRAKTGMNAERLRRLRKLTDARGALLLLNDHWRVAREFNCDGVHVGPADDGFDDPQRVRAAWPEAILGLSTGTPEEARRVDIDAIDYLGVGAVFATASKTDAGNPIGISGLRAVAAATSLPICAIGGIDCQRIADVRVSGVAMAAVIAALGDASDPARAALDLVARWNGR